MRRWEHEVVGGRGLVRAVWQWRRGPVADGLGFVGRDWFEGDFFFEKWFEGDCGSQPVVCE